MSAAPPVRGDAGALAGGPILLSNPRPDAGAAAVARRAFAALATGLYLGLLVVLLAAAFVTLEVLAIALIGWLR